LADELNAAETVYQAVLASHSSTLSPDLKKANAEAGAFIIGAKKVIGFSLGDAWTPAWAEAGFLHDHLKCPKKVVERIALLDRLAIYLGGHPESQSETQKITATRASELHRALAKASRAIGHYDTERKEARTTRDKAKTALHKMAADVIVEIRRKLTVTSPLWDSFGLNAPKPRAPRPRKVKAATVSQPASRSTTKATSESSAASGETTVSLAS